MGDVASYKFVGIFGETFLPGGIGGDKGFDVQPFCDVFVCCELGIIVCCDGKDMLFKGGQRL